MGLTKAERMAQDAARRKAMAQFEQDAARALLKKQSLPVGEENLLICGVDEAGRGPLAGPVAAAAVILPADCDLPWLNDSKQVTEKRREVLFAQIQEVALAHAVVFVDAARIDEINILQATLQAMREAIERLAVPPQVVLADAVTIPGLSCPQQTVIKGAAKCLSIAAASILAKVTRDRFMQEADRTYPGYGFSSNKGYGSAAHIEALRRLGPTPLHRRSFLSSILGEQN